VNTAPGFARNSFENRPSILRDISRPIGRNELYFTVFSSVSEEEEAITFLLSVEALSDNSKT
jgi:hypothetical protein